MLRASGALHYYSRPGIPAEHPCTSFSYIHTFRTSSSAGPSSAARTSNTRANMWRGANSFWAEHSPIRWTELSLFFAAPSRDLVRKLRQNRPLRDGRPGHRLEGPRVDHGHRQGRRASFAARPVTPSQPPPGSQRVPRRQRAKESLTALAFLCTMRALYSRVDSVPCSRTITARRVAPPSFACCATLRCAASRSSCAC